jgi:hypothetical protein
MKTTVEVPDGLYRRAKVEAARRGRKLKDLVEEGLRLVLETPRDTRCDPSLAGLMKRASVQALSDGSLRDRPPRLPGAGRDPFRQWAPACAGVTVFLMSALARRRLRYLLIGSAR